MEEQIAMRRQSKLASEGRLHMRIKESLVSIDGHGATLYCAVSLFQMANLNV